MTGLRIQLVNQPEGFTIKCEKHAETYFVILSFLSISWSVCQKDGPLTDMVLEISINKRFKTMIYSCS
jgi:hypothetical protein